MQDPTAGLAAMRERYAATSANTVAAFERLAEQFEQSPNADALITALRRELHRVHGTAGSVGFESASRLAASMQTVTAKWVKDPDLDRERRGDIIAQFARSLRDALAEPAGESDARDMLATELYLLVGLTDEVAAELISETMLRGARVERVTNDALQGALEREIPTAIVSQDIAIAPAIAVGVPRVLLVTAAATDDYHEPSPGQRVLDARSEPKAVLETLDVLRQATGPAGGCAVVVDDEPVVRSLIRMLLEADGLRVVERDSADDFLAAVRDANPLLLVLDVDLPNSSGLALIKQVRATPEFAETPILMLTGHTDPGTRTASFAAGADDYMLKPIVPPEFQSRVGRLLQTNRARRLTGGLHETTGLSLRARTMREIEARLRQWSGQVTCACVVRPLSRVSTRNAEAAWHAESSRVARAIRALHGFAGFVDGTSLGAALPVPSSEALELLAGLLGEAPDDAPPWRAGVVQIEVADARTPRELIDSAESACVAARDSNVPVRLWNPDDADVAPDVIVVEDDDALAEMEVFALEARGLTHRRFATGPSALEALVHMRARGRRPIVLLDVDLPGLDGHSLNERLRIERPNAYDVVFVSVHSSEADQLRALQAGALDYITKPIRMRVLMAKIDSWRSRSPSA